MNIFGVLGGFFAAAAYATIKKIKDIYDARLIMLSFMGVGMVIPLILFLFTPYANFQIHTQIWVWVLVVLMALVSTTSQWFLTRAYSISNASIIGVVSYTNIPFAVGFGVLLGDLLPDFYTLIGIILIVIGGILVTKKSSKKVDFMESSDVLYQKIADEFNLGKISFIETIQILWSGYGKLVRLKFSNKSIIVKHVKLPKKSSHPRGWNTDLSHKRKLHSYEVEVNWYRKFSKNIDNNCRIPQGLKCIQHENEWLIVMEDLANIGFTSTPPMPIKHILNLPFLG